MKAIFSGLICLAILAGLARDLPAGASRAGSPVGGKSPSITIARWRSGIYFGHAYLYPHYTVYYPPALVVSPHSYPSYVAPTIVVTWPYFCALHNEGFVTRVGLLDHLSGIHKVPLDAAVNFCPDGSKTCLFPSY